MNPRQYENLPINMETQLTQDEKINRFVRMANDPSLDWKTRLSALLGKYKAIAPNWRHGGYPFSVNDFLLLIQIVCNGQGIDERLALNTLAERANQPPPDAPEAPEAPETNAPAKDVLDVVNAIKGETPETEAPPAKRGRRPKPAEIELAAPPEE